MSELTRTTKKKKKKTTTSNSMRLSKAEKELIKNYRKCNVLEKKIVSLVCEKAAGDLKDAIGVLKNIPTDMQ